MTAIEFRLKKMRELEALLEKLAALEEGPLKRELKERFSRTYLRQIERITGILDNPALARLCSGYLTIFDWQGPGSLDHGKF